MEKFERICNEAKDALGFGDVAALAALMPQVSALRKDQQMSFMLEVVSSRRPEMLAPLYAVQWKLRDWRGEAVVHAGGIGCLDIVQLLEPQVSIRDLRHALTHAAFGMPPTEGQMEVLRYLTPIVHAGKEPLAHAVRNVVLSLRQRSPFKEADMDAHHEKLMVLLRLVRVEVAIQHMIKTESEDWFDEHIPGFANAITLFCQDPEFITAQARMKAPRPGAWRQHLSDWSPLCDAALRRMEAHCAAVQLQDSVADVPSAPSRASRL